jgi:putative transposase
LPTNPANEREPQLGKGLEFLTDNGPEFVACRTPCRSPQSNGLVESFFGSFKRDYLSHQPLETLAEAMKHIPEEQRHHPIR